jgi:hypothetical protein
MGERVITLWVYVLPVLLGIDTPNLLHVASPNVRLCPFAPSPTNRGRNILHSPHYHL